jgi:FKBP-type peptidyl-prolyl cis-trans isomerase
MRSCLNIGIIAVLSLLITWSCHRVDESKTGEKLPQQDPSESLVKANRYLVQKETEDIENYIKRHQWTMQETGSGLRYWIYEAGDGPVAKRGMVAELAYKVWLINGEMVYDAERDGLKSFLIGKGGVESGLEEAILLMRKGDKARLVIPSHLAWGLLGDQKKIPPRTAIVYEMELLNLK